jgi:23S rRNA maturation mini-RNase III
VKPVKSSKRKAAAPASPTSESSSSEEDEEERVKRARTSRHVGRYQKRERAKHVKNYSATDLEAILGSNAVREASPELPQFAEVRAVVRDDSEDSDEEDAPAMLGKQ